LQKIVVSLLNNRRESSYIDLSYCRFVVLLTSVLYEYYVILVVCTNSMPQFFLEKGNMEFLIYHKSTIEVKKNWQFVKT